MITATRIVASFAVAFVFLITDISAQSSSVDLGFSPVVSRDMTTEETAGKGLLVQPDNKVVIWGGDFAIDGAAKGRVARLNVGGTVDNTFSYCGCLLAGINNVDIQADGKLLVAGYITGFQAKIVRLNQDGSHDGSFVSSITGITGVSSGVEIVRIQPDGKILAKLTQGLSPGFHSGDLIRLNADGTTDSSFTWIAYDGGRLVYGDLAAVELDPAGRLYVSVTTSSGGISNSTLRRYNSNGTLDNTWTSPSFSPSSGSRYDGLAVQADGALVIVGGFETVNGVPKRNVVRILPAGNVDLDFSPPVLGTNATQVKIVPGGKILVGYSLAGAGEIARLDATTGAVDNTFVVSSSVNSVLNEFVLDGLGRILFLGISDRPAVRYFRLNPNGDRDTTFDPNVTVFAKLRSMALQPDGKVIVAGAFSQINGILRSTIARVNTDGTLDSSFDPGTGFNSPPYRLAVQADGKILATGFFASYNDFPRAAIARINPNGSLDTAFGPVIEGEVAAVGVQSDGKVLISGNFTSVDAVARTGAARLNADGSLDNSFNPFFGSPYLREIFQQPDGKIIVAGAFSGVNGFNRTGIVRLMAADGSLDQTFNAGTSVSASRAWLQADGKYVLATTTAIFRRNSDGTPDTSFATSIVAVTDSSFATIDTVVTQPDGSIIAGGRFDRVGSTSRSNIVRLTPTGNVDVLFLPQGADGAVRASLRQADGKVVIGGEFGRVQGVLRAGAARLNVTAFHGVTPFDFDGDGRADITVFRPSTNRWYEALSTGPVVEETFGLSGDIVVPADYDGDGITDEAIFRPSGDNSQWWYKSSINGSQVLNQFGAGGDIPRPSDFDGDGKADFVLYRAGGLWTRFSSLTRQASNTTFGLAGDQPLVGDFDGDGKGDLAVFRPSNGDWWYAATSAGGAFRNVHWGQNGDIPVPADYDGDGKTDFAIYRPSEGGWYIYNSSNGSFTTTAFGIATDRPVAADYDGDGRADIAVFRPSTGIWYLLRSTAGFAGYQFGISTDVALPAALIP